jgi:hypothetical protein
MPIHLDSSPLGYEPISSLVIQTLLTAFTFLSAFSIRDTVTKCIELVAPTSAVQRLMYHACLCLFFLFLTVFMAYMFQDRVEV